MPDARRVILNARVAGRDARVMLDTGAGPLALDRRFLKGRVGGETPLQDMSAVTSAARATPVDVMVAGVSLVAEKPALIDLSMMNAFLPHPVDAILGRDLFGRFPIEIDFPRRRMRIWESNTPPFFGDDLAVIQQANGLPVVSIAIGSLKDVPALLDIGADRALYLSPQFARNNGVLTGRKTSTGVSGGVAGMQVSTVAVLDDLSFGAATFAQVPVEVPPDWRFDAPAILGLPVIRRLGHVYFDLPRHRLRFNAATIQGALPFRKDRSGFGVVPRQDGLEVVHVAADSPAARAGLVVGTEIVAINGQRCNRDYLASHGRDGAQPSGTVLHLTLANGVSVPLTLSDYF